MRRSEPELFKDKVEVSLDGRQIFYLFFGGAVIACLVFVLGVMVGKRVEARSHVATGAATTASEDPLAALDELSANHEQLSFPQALTGQDDEPLGPVDEVLQAPPPEKAAAKPEPKAARPEPKAAKPEPKPAPKVAKPEPKPEVVDDKSHGSKHSWTLQLSSFQDRAEADSFRDRLVDAGYDPYIAEADVPNKGTWYRVRLGSYGSYDGAIKAKREFESAQKIIAYVTRVK